jgi:hypothetical protein
MILYRNFMDLGRRGAPCVCVLWRNDTAQIFEGWKCTLIGTWRGNEEEGRGWEGGGGIHLVRVLGEHMMYG